MSEGGGGEVIDSEVSGESAESADTTTTSSTNWTSNTEDANWGESKSSGEGVNTGNGVQGDDWAKLGGMLDDAANGKGNFYIGKATSEQIDAMGQAWVGDDPKVTSIGSFESADGLRSYRPPTYKENWDEDQANLSSRYRPYGQWQNNAHITVDEDSGDTPGTGIQDGINSGGSANGQ